MLSAAVNARLILARDNQPRYQPNSLICKQLQEKSIVMCVGPVAVGKSFVMNRVVTIDNDFQRTPVFTTRDARSDDEPGMFRIQPHNDTSVSKILDQIDAGEIVQYAVHPTSGRIYGTTINDYPGKFNLLAMLSGGVSQLQQLPYASTHVIGFATQPQTWKQWLTDRYPVPSDERQKRLKEATVSLEWLLNNPTSVRWVENSADNPNQAAGLLRSIVKYNQEDSKGAAEYARQMLKTAEEML